jgi:hypothetical protein
MLSGLFSRVRFFYQERNWLEGLCILHDYSG